MKLRNLLSASLAFAAVVGTVAFAAPADARSFKSYINGITGGGGSGGFNVNASATISAMQNTAATLDGMISSGLSSGRINPSMAANFRAQLGQITAAQDNMMASGTLNASTVQSLTGQYANLTTQVNAALSGTANFGYNPYGAGNYVNPYANPQGYQYNTNYYGGLNTPLWY